jgi:hypothetical protein
VKSVPNQKFLFRPPALQGGVGDSARLVVAAGGAEA